MTVAKSEDLQLFQVDSDHSGEITACKDPFQPLEANHVYILINKGLSKIFIILGAQADVRSRFIGAQVAQTIRREHNLTYKVASIDQGQEAAAFTVPASPPIPNEQIKPSIQKKQPEKAPRRIKPPKRVSEIVQRTLDYFLKEKSQAIPISEIGRDNHIQLFQVASDNSGELKTCNDPSQLLVEEKVFLLLNDDLSKIFIWLGSEANVRSKFVGARAAQTVRRARGIEYRVLTVEPGKVPLGFSDSIMGLIREKDSTSAVLSIHDYNAKLAKRLLSLQSKAPQSMIASSKIKSPEDWEKGEEELELEKMALGK
ncbi:MAG: hypothetical protein ACFFGZ_18255 [Candidatus Thorarchaeota archaeon]